MVDSPNASLVVADDVLIRRLKADDPAVLRTILDRYWGPLVAFAGRLLGEGTDAEDAVQEALARLWKRRKALKLEGSFRALLYTVVRNCCLDELRRRRRRNESEGLGPFPPSPRTPWEDVHGAELERAAAAAVAGLPERRREVFRLVREEGLSYREVSRVLGLAPQTVANHMSLAMADLRTSLKPFLPSGTADFSREGSEPHREGSTDRDQPSG